ncbi:MAG TPA: hypothetical protein VGM56_07805, partial [Byssovorax sp.]
IADAARALPHIEALLARDAAHEKARSVAVDLLGHPATRGEAARILADTFERLGNTREAADMLAIQFADAEAHGEQTRAARAESERRLAIAKHDLGDLVGAEGLFEAIVARDAADDDARRRYRAITTALDRRLAFVDVVERSTAAAAPTVRALALLDVAEVLLEAGDEARAAAALQQILALDVDDGARASALHRLVSLHEASGDARALAATLEALVAAERDPAAKDTAAERLARVREERLGDVPGAIEIYRALVHGRLAAVAVAALEGLYARAARFEDLADLIEARARQSSGPAALRLALRAAEIRAARLPAGGAAAKAALEGDTIDERAVSEHAIEVWRAHVAAHGPSREAHARLLPLLTQERRWSEWVDVMTSDVALAAPSERPPLQVALARVALDESGDPARALSLLADAAMVAPATPGARELLDRLLAYDAQRLGAAEALDGVARAAGDTAALVGVLEIKGALAQKVSARLGAYEEAVTLTERDLADAAGALELAGAALAVAVRGEPKRVTSWLDRVERLAAAADQPARKAALLGGALGDVPVDNKALARLARRAGAALEVVGDVEPALALYARS